MTTEFQGYAEGFDPVDVSEQSGIGPLEGTREVERNAPMGLVANIEGPQQRQKEIDDFLSAACCLLQAFVCLIENCPKDSNLYESLANTAPPDSALRQMLEMVGQIRKACFLKKIAGPVKAATSIDISPGCIEWLNRLGWIHTLNMPPRWTRPFGQKNTSTGIPGQLSNTRPDFNALITTPE